MQGQTQASAGRGSPTGRIFSDRSWRRPGSPARSRPRGGRWRARWRRRSVRRRTGLIVELGPGTGPVTRSLIERGVDARAAGARRIRSRILPDLEGAFRDRPGSSRATPTIFRARSRNSAATADCRRCLQPAAAQSAAGSARKADRRRLRADGAVRACSFSSLTVCCRPFPREFCAKRYSAVRGRGRSCSICRLPGCGPIGSRTMPGGGRVN